MLHIDDIPEGLSGESKYRLRLLVLVYQNTAADGFDYSLKTAAFGKALPVNRSVLVGNLFFHQKKDDCFTGIYF